MNRTLARRTLLSAVLLVVALTGIASAAPRLPRLWARTNASVKPKLVYIAADGTYIVGGASGHSRATTTRGLGSIHWVSYGAKSAKGTGTLWTLQIGPHSYFAAHKATITASAVHGGQFTALTMLYAWKGRTQTQKYSLVKGQFGDHFWQPNHVPVYAK